MKAVALKCVVIAMFVPVLICTGCSQLVRSEYQRGKLVKEVKSDTNSITEKKAVVSLKSPTSVKVVDEIQYGKKVEQFYVKEKYEERGKTEFGYGIRHELLMRPLMVMFFPFMIPSIIKDPTGFSEFFTFGLNDCSKASNHVNCTYWSNTDEVSDEFFTDFTYADITTKQLPVSSEIVTVKISSGMEQLYNGELSLGTDGSATLDLAKIQNLIPESGEVTVQYGYKDQTKEASISRKDVEKALAARKPPQLMIAQNVSYGGGLKTGTLIGDEKGELTVSVTNTDKGGVAWGVRLNAAGNECREVTFAADIPVGDINPGESKTVSVPIAAGLDAANCKLNLNLQAKEEFGQDSKKVKIPTISIKAVDRPALSIASITHQGTPQNNDSVEIDAIVANSGIGEAKGVVVTLNDLPEGVTPSQRNFSIGDMSPESKQKVSLSLHFDKRYGAGVKSVPFSLSVADKRPICKPAQKGYSMAYRFNKPVIKIADVRYFDGNDPDGQSEGNSNGQIEQGERIAVQVRVANTGTMEADNVAVTLLSDKPSSLLIINPSEQQVANLKPGEVKTVVFKFSVPNSIQPGPATFTVNAKEVTFSTQVAEVSRKDIYETGAIDAAVILAATGAPRQTAGKTLPPVGENIDEVRSSGYRRDGYALVIGISQYRLGNVKQLQFAKNDAQTMRDYLEKVGGFPREQIHMLPDDQATLSGIKRELGWIRRNAGEKSQVFIYYSGHGVADSRHLPYLLPYDGEPQTIEDTGYALSTLKDEVNKFKTRRVLIALDACYTGEGRSESADGSHGVAWVDDDETKTEAVIISASGPKEASWDYDEKQHGLFTYFMLKGMRGSAPSANGNDMVDVEELYKYIKSKVPPMASTLRDAPQSPSKQGNGKGMIVSKRVE